MIQLFEQLKEQIRNRNKKINDIKQQSPLNFDDHKELMSDNNYHILTGLNFNDLCSYISPFSLQHSNITTFRMIITILSVKLRLDLSHQALCTLFGLKQKSKSIEF
jgi:hypothetical protein